MLLLSALPARAQNPNFIDTKPANPWKISGSDTLNKVMDDLLTALTASGQLSGGINRYLGIGSSCGERQLEGSPTTSDGPENVCTPNDASGLPEGNPGCQEISPMSRPLGSAICDDDPNYPLTINNQAEGLGFCADGLVITAHNDSLGGFGDSAAACADFHALPNTANTENTFPDRGVGHLRTSGTLPTTGYVLNGWRDVIRLVYTGCRNTEGACANLNNRIERCNSDVRKEVVANWANLFEGVACPQSGGCPNGLIHAFRRDDSSGTTGVFLELLQVAANVAANLTSRAALINTVPPSIVAIPNNLAFCDGGQVEGLIPTHIGPASAQFPSGEPLYTNGDPIRINCLADDDLCGPDGKLGLVRAIRSSDQVVGNAYPNHQCRRSFEYKQFINTALPVCPDRTTPSAGRCRLPFYQAGAFKTFNCLTSARQADSKAVAGTDGRVYNYLMREQDGTVAFQAARLPWTASWRQDMAKLDNSALAQGKVFPASDFVCIQADATRNIGCLTSVAKCTIGFAGRESAFNNVQPTVHLANEPVKLNGFTPSSANIGANAYPFSRLLYMNAIRGFENIMEDCKNRGGSKAFCEDQHRIALEFFNVGQPSNVIGQICTNAGYIAIPAAVCLGAQGSTGAAACGAPTIQTLTDCTPDTRSYDSLVNND